MIIYLWSIRSNFCFCFYIHYLHLLLIVVLFRHCRVYLEVQTPRYLCLEVLFSPTRLFGSPPSTVTPMGFSFGKQAPSFCAYYLFSFLLLFMMIYKVQLLFLLLSLIFFVHQTIKENGEQQFNYLLDFLHCFRFIL